MIEELDVAHSIYEVPLDLQREKLDELVCKLSRPERRLPNLDRMAEDAPTG